MVHRLKVSFLVAGLDENFVMKTNTSVRLDNTIHERIEEEPYSCPTHAHEVNDLIYDYLTSKASPVVDLGRAVTEIS